MSETVPRSGYPRLAINGSVTSTEYMPTQLLFTPMIQLIRKDSDMSEHSRQLGASSTSSSLLPSSPSNHLSNQAIAGIIEGVLFAVLAMISAVIYLLQIRRKEKPDYEPTPSSEQSGIELSGIAIFGTDKVKYPRTPQELLVAEEPQVMPTGSIHGDASRGDYDAVPGSSPDDRHELE